MTYLIEYPAPEPFRFWQLSRIRMGFKKIGNEYHIRIPHVDGENYTEFQVIRENQETAFFQPFFEMLRSGTQVSWEEERKPLGFGSPSKAVEKVVESDR